MSKLRETIAQSWWTIQDTLFPRMIEELGPLTQKQQELITTLEILHIEAFIDSSKGYPGRPPKDRVAIARAFVAKMVYHMPTTRLLLDRLHTDIALRRLCGWERVSDIPKEWTVSRAFAEFSESQLPQRIHEALIKKHYCGEIVGHNSRDSTAINAREKPIKKKPIVKQPKQRGRPKKGEVREKTLTRIEKQTTGIPLEEIMCQHFTVHTTTHHCRDFDPGIATHLAQAPFI